VSGKQDAYAADVDSVNEFLPKILSRQIKPYDPLNVCDNCIIIILVSYWTFSLVLSIFKIYDVLESDPFSETSCFLNTPESIDSVHVN
jgi:hypothetical protein